jgi:putative transposase
MPFPPGRICQVPVIEIRQRLIQLFIQWGKPQAIRTDNGEPFGIPSRETVPLLSLWLIAFGIRPILNRPRIPQENAKVERNQRTTSLWAEVYDCATLEEVQEKLDDACEIQRNHYPVRKLKNASRSQVFKGLYEIARPFDVLDFDEKKAWQYLEKVTHVRKISSSGVIAMYGGSLYLDYKRKSQIVRIKFRADDQSWLMYEATSGNLIKVTQDPRFSRENLFNLTICQRTFYKT